MDWIKEAKIHRLTVGPIVLQVEPRGPRLWGVGLLVGTAPALAVGAPCGTVKKAKHEAESFLAGIMLAGQDLAMRRERARETREANKSG